MFSTKANDDSMIRRATVNATAAARQSCHPCRRETTKDSVAATAMPPYNQAAVAGSGGTHIATKRIAADVQTTIAA